MKGTIRSNRSFLTTILFFVVAALGLSSCDNTVDINADWKETIVVYGLLDPYADTQYIRVGKAYLDEKTGAMEVAKISDSLFLDSADVALIEVSSGMKLKLVPAFATPKNPGLFANDKNPIFAFYQQGLNYIKPNETYRLEITNPRTGSRITATTKTLEQALIQSPVSQNGGILSMNQELFTVSFKPGQNSYAYDIKMDVVVDEIDKNDTSKKVRKTIRWNFINNFQVSSSNTTVVQRIPRISFFQFLSSSLKADPKLLHKLISCEFIYFGGNQTLADYISVNEPSIGIVQKQAEYSNIEGGYGIFASRVEQHVRDVKFDPGVTALLKVNDETKALNWIL